MTATQTTPTTWQISGDYFENCNCDVICPCLASPAGPLAAQPTQGACEAPLAFHIASGSYGDATLDGLNAVVILRTPGPMAEGNGTVALYVDERADERQREALTAIFSGQAGGPMGTLAPLVSEILGVKAAPITFRIENRRRSVEVPGIMHMGVSATPNINPDEETWLTNAHPLFPDKIAIAVGDADSVYEDYDMRWDNSGKNGLYAPYSWSNA
jgi:hypothetical protein